MRAYAMGIVNYEDIVKYCAKVTPLKNSILISAEMYLNEASEFNVAFETLLEQVKSTTQTLKD